MAAPTRQILAFGDSLTEGYYRMGFGFHPYSIKLQGLLQSLPASNYEIITSGWSGKTTTDLETHLRKELRKKSFDIGIILAGTNDLGVKEPEEGKPLFGRIKYLHELFLKHNKNTKTVALTLPETGYELSVTWVREKRKNVNEMLKAYSDESAGRVVICDFAEEFPRERLCEEELNKFWDDGLHLTPQGYDRMAEIIFDALRPLLL
ncbi:predicted protein [Nematostella vectensis]|uniref:SGNH hydrolase-type esterase domain-containing protein n=1 Tax=Nematostella vectensis TaxID=45351 RepID=A7RJR4_NEMVE|nr:predicted protein [Nematostella vectensis]|eukprot:XP_001640376.1 predicted protein [Nematostella vectensis]